jgi:hypothetical protein
LEVDPLSDRTAIVDTVALPDFLRPMGHMSLCVSIYFLFLEEFI